MHSPIGSGLVLGTLEQDEGDSCRDDDGGPRPGNDLGNTRDVRTG